jgi:hypothetical protein
MILTLARGHYCPKEHQQHLELAAHYPKIAVAYTQVVTSSTDDHQTLQEFRASLHPVDLPIRPRADHPARPRHRRIHRPPTTTPMIPHTLVLKPGLVVHSVCNGYWFWGRPSFHDPWRDLHAVTAEIRPDWDLSTPGLRQASDAGDSSQFYGWDRNPESRSPQRGPTRRTTLPDTALIVGRPAVPATDVSGATHGIPPLGPRTPIVPGCSGHSIVSRPQICLLLTDRTSAGACQHG